jgi:hypothetical protein
MLLIPAEGVQDVVICRLVVCLSQSPLSLPYVVRQCHAFDYLLELSSQCPASGPQGRGGGNQTPLRPGAASRCQRHVVIGGSR